MADLKHQAAVTALNKMMRGAHFSICTIDTIATLLDVVPDPDAYKTLRALHCVDYSAMPRDIYANLPALIQQALSGTPVFQFEVRQREPLNLGLDGAARPGEIRMVEDSAPRRRFLRLFGHG